VERKDLIALIEGALQRVPAPLLQPLLDVAALGLGWRHRAVFERLAAFAGVSVLVLPSGAPRGLLLELPRAHAAPALTLVDTAMAPRADVVLRGALAALVDLVEGRVDGDALFFDRRLVCTGDTVALVALRNAVDGAAIDLAADLFAPFGSAAPRIRRLGAAAAARLVALVPLPRSS
jgi:predicted lipid carrier protein YhbT